MTVLEFNECVKMYADKVYRFIQKNLRNEEDTRDVVQGAFEKLWINREEVETPRADKYLFTIAYHLMIDHIRRNKKMIYTDELPEPKAANSISEKRTLNRILNEALQTLSETQRSLVMLKDYEGYSYEEIGTITGLNQSQVKVYLHRARLQLRAYIVKPENVI